MKTIDRIIERLPHDSDCDSMPYAIITGNDYRVFPADASRCNCPRAELVAYLKKRDQLATVAEFLLDACHSSYGGWNVSEPSPREFHIEWGTQQHAPDFNPVGELLEQAQHWNACRKAIGLD